MGAVEPSTVPVRIDKWLWAARFFKNRTLAADAVKGGKVEINGARVKASKDVHVGDELLITIGTVRRTVHVRGTLDRRGPASVARQLYEETPESIARREEQALQRRMAPPLGADMGMRPTKRDRRRLEATPGARKSRR
jgi:ribosome-associated heat shock protein Hsp15